MSTKDILTLSVFVVVGILIYKCYSFQILEEQMFPAGLPNLNFSRRLKKETTKSEICIGRRCALPSQQHKSNSDFFISSVILSMIGLAIHLTVNHERGRTAHTRSRTAANAFKRTAHSTSIACSSLSPSPVPRTKRPSPQKSAAAHHNCCKIPWDRMAKSSDFEVCLSLHPSPLMSNGSCNRSYSSSSATNYSSSTSGLYPCAPPRRWLGNSRLNLVTSPEVVPREVDLYYHL